MRAAGDWAKFSQWWGKKQYQARGRVTAGGDEAGRASLGPGRPRRPLPHEQGLCFDGFGDYLGEGSDVVFGGIEGAHPADDAFFFDPHVEEVAGFDFFDGVARDLDEYSVGLDGPDYFDAGDAGDFLFQQSGHAISVLGAAAPEVVREQGFELHGDEAHF